MNPLLIFKSIFTRTTATKPESISATDSSLLEGLPLAHTPGRQQALKSRLLVFSIVVEDVEGSEYDLEQLFSL
jgi:hypothetical protein